MKFCMRDLCITIADNCKRLLSFHKQTASKLHKLQGMPLEMLCRPITLRSTSFPILIGYIIVNWCPFK
jgi:hypothetical protein